MVGMEVFMDLRNLKPRTARFLNEVGMHRVKAWLEGVQFPPAFVLADNPIARAFRPKGSPLVEILLNALDREGHVRGYWMRMFTTGHRATVHIIAITSEGEVVVNAEYRVNNNCAFQTAPSGVKKDGEDMVVAALRELAEESGYQPGSDSQIFHLGAMAPHGAVLTLLEDVIVITNVVPCENGSTPSVGEFILQTRLLSFDTILDMLRNNVELFHAPTLAAIMIAMAYGFVQPSESALATAKEAGNRLQDLTSANS